VKVAIVGSREYPALHLVTAYVASLKKYDPTITVVSGNARGVDKTAQEEALRLALRVLIIPADWSQGKGAGFARNEEIVMAADVIVCFWDGESQGTAHDIKLARVHNKRLRVFGPEGEILYDERPAGTD
jgi:hypothetical protein